MTKVAPGLGGEADPNAWHFSRLGEEGPLPNPTGHTMPVLSHDDTGEWQVVGTAFYVNQSGFFITARHVIEHVFKDGKQVAPLALLELLSPIGLFGASEAKLRPIQQCWLGQPQDIAMGIAAPERATSHHRWIWALSWTTPVVGAQVTTYAFPDHTPMEGRRGIRFSPNAYSGKLLSTGDFLDKVMVPYPYLEVDFRIHGAASGGPIFSDGYVVGINCVEFPKNLDHPPGPGFGAQIRCLEDAFFDGVALPGERAPRRVTFDELVAAHCLTVKDYAPREATRARTGRLVMFDKHPTAKPPAVETMIYA